MPGCTSASTRKNSAWSATWRWPAQVQLRLLPPAPPSPRSAEIAASFRPARSIGGDIYDFLDYGPAPHPEMEDPEDESAAVSLALHVAPGRTLFVLGDVSGKAAPAALYAALVSGILRSLAPQHLPPARLLAALNEQLQERKLASQYVTMLLALWDDAARTFCVANAGSVQPILMKRRDDGAFAVQTIGVEGFPLGLFPHANYDETLLELCVRRPGRLLFRRHHGRGQ